MDKGYFYIPYEYICNPDLTSDLWAVEPETHSNQVQEDPETPNIQSTDATE